MVIFSYMIIWLYGIVFGGTTTPILFQWLVSRIVFTSAPSFHDIIIPIFYLSIINFGLYTF